MPINPISVRYFAGIDPGTYTGFCIYDAEDKELTHLCKTDFWGAYSLVCSQDPENIVVVIECPYLIKRTYKDHASPDESKAYWNKISRDAGGNAREAYLLVTGLRDLGFTVEERKPQGEKWDHTAYEQITGYKGRVSDHERDAVRFVWGRGTRYYPIR